MGRVFWHVTMSLDGFIAGPDDPMDWVFSYVPLDSAAMKKNAGGNYQIPRFGVDWQAKLQRGQEAGQRPETRKVLGGAWVGPVFVRTHNAPDGDEDSSVKFLSGNIRRAIAVTRDAAGGKDVKVSGADIARQSIQEGLVDENRAYLAPVLLGDGVRFFNWPGQPRAVRAELMGATRLGQATDPQFRVMTPHESCKRSCYEKKLEYECDMILLLDNYDSFTYNLAQYLGQMGQQLAVRRNDEITLDEIAEMAPERIVISPGPCTPKEAGISVPLIQRFAGEIPILGVCLGHQAIGAAFGGRVIRAPKLMHGKTSEIEHDGRTIFQGLPQSFIATRYHSLIVERKSLPRELEISAETEDGTIMGFRHRKLRVEGVQFHPESVLTGAGFDLLKNFLSI